MANNISTYNLIKQGLDVANLRAETISNNITNVNTDGYKAFKVVFEDNYSDENLSLETTSDKHMNIGGEAGEINVIKDESTSMNENGNNVDLDQEKVNQAANTLLYNALITQANSKLTALKTVIGGN